MSQELHYKSPLREAVHSVDFDKPVQAAREFVNGGGKNVSPIERELSVAAGAALAVAGLSRINSIPGIVLAGVSAGLLWRGLTGNCALYKALGVSTNHR